MTTNSASKKPTISVRSNMMGLATVAKLGPTRALLIDKHNNWILATPGDTFGDPTLDLTEKMTRYSIVAFKANRLSGDRSNYNGIAIYVRPIDKCISGEGTVDIIKPTFGYGSSMKHGSIFFPVSSINETVINAPSLRRHHDLSKYLRESDPISFVAIADESTKNRSAFAVEVQLGVNMIEGTPMMGIITEAKESSCKIWAKNFPNFTLDNSAFGVDSTVDLREIFIEGDRIMFQAAKIGCGIDGISNVIAVGQESQAKLERAKAMIQGEDAGTETVGGNDTDVATGAMRDLLLKNGVYWPKCISAGFNVKYVDAVNCTFEQEVPFDVGDLEEELGDVDARLEAEDFNGQSTDTPPTPRSGPVATGESGAHSSAGGEVIPKKEYVDAQVQVSSMVEVEAVKTFLEDKDIFTLACQRHPDLVRQLFFLRRSI